jgi:signal transduction histidine kinase
MRHAIDCPGNSTQQHPCNPVESSLPRRLLPAFMFMVLCAGVAIVPPPATIAAQPQQTRRWEASQPITSHTLTAAPDSRWICILSGSAISVLLWRLCSLRLSTNTLKSRSRAAGMLEERERIARELHDTLIQSTHALILSLQASIARLSKNDRLRKEIDSALDRAADLLDEARDRVSGLRVPNVPLDVARAIADSAKTLAMTKLVNFRLAVTGTPRPLQPIGAEHIYAIAREGLTNAFAHAKATTIEVEVEYRKKGLRVRVRDDGCGIASDAGIKANSARHFGLRGMRERAAQIDAQLTIRSREGAGTEITTDLAAANAYLHVPSHRWQQMLREFAASTASLVRSLVASGKQLTPITTQYGNDQQARIF